MAALKTSLGCITEEFNVPINIVSSFITIFLVFKNKATKCSWVKSFILDIIISATSLGDLIFTFSIELRLFILSPNSKAAFSVTALCNPIPFIFNKSCIESNFNSFKLFTLLIISFAISILETPCRPVLIKIANNSLLDKLFSPYWMSLSLGSSLLAISLIFKNITFSLLVT